MVRRPAYPILIGYSIDPAAAMVYVQDSSFLGQESFLVQSAEVSAWGVGSSFAVAG
jgi:hypothetical protein